MKRNYSSLLAWMRPVGSGLALVAGVGCCTSAYGGGIVVNHDEWTLSDFGFGQEGAANGTTFAQNMAAFLTGGSGSILIYSGNFGLTGSGLQSALTAGGYSVTEDPGLSTTFTAANLSANYAAVFLAGQYPIGDMAVLQNYVTLGGGVYVAAGTGTGGAAAEAAQWNSFLSPYGLSLGSPYNGVSGTLPVVSSSPILSGVTQLYYNNGNDVFASGSAEVIASTGSHGLIGVYSVSMPDQTSTGVLAGLSFVLLGAGIRYRRIKSVTDVA